MENDEIEQLLNELRSELEDQMYKELTRLEQKIEDLETEICILKEQE
jgi:hypothetical protein